MNGWDFMNAHPVATFFIIIAIGMAIPSFKWKTRACCGNCPCHKKDGGKP